VAENLSEPQTSSSQDLKLSRKQADAWWLLQDNKTTEIIYGGGAGGGKSFLGCVWHIFRRLQYPRSRGLIGRSDLAALEQSTLKTLLDVAHSMGYKQGVDFKYNSQKHIITWTNGSETILKDLFLYPSDPDFISMGSTEYTDAFVDEANEITEKAFDILNSRIRYRLHEFGLVPKILLTCNPGHGWLKEKYISKDGFSVALFPYQRVVRALVTDNPDKDFVKIYSTQLDRMRSEYDKERLLYGNWDVESDAKNPFAHQWDSMAHTGETVENYERQLFISMDFNLNPYAVTFWQVYKLNGVLYIEGIDEFEMQNGNIPDMCDQIQAKYSQRLLTAILTGDSMGNQRDMARRDNASHYIEIARKLRLSTLQVKTPANPTHKNSRMEVNTILNMAKFTDKVKITIDRKKMKNTIRDFEVVQCDANEGIIKKDRKDLNQRADYLDTARSLFHLVNLQFGLWKN